MEILSIVGTSIKGCVTLFNVCVGLYDLIDRGSSFGKDYMNLMTKLDVEKFRLLAFGEALRIVGLDPEALDLSRNETLTAIEHATWNLIERVLCGMKEVFDDTKDLNKRYGLKQAKFASLQGGGADMILGSTSTGAFAATFQRFQARILRTQKGVKFIAKTRWAVHDGDKFKKLIEKLHGWNNDLDNILQSLQRAGLQRLIIEHEFQMMTSVDDIHIIEEVAADDNPTISDMASSRRRLLQEPLASNHVAPSIGTESSFSDRSFWTAPSRAVYSLVDNLNSLHTTDHEAVAIDSTPQNQRLFAGKATQLEQLQQQNSDARSYGQLLKPLRIQDAAKCTDGLFGPASKRVRKEIETFAIRSAGYVSLSPIDDSLHQLLGSIEGPPDTPYHGGVFFIRIDLMNEYPMVAPRCVFITRIYHPNIGPQGKICLSILGEDWYPSWQLSTVLLAICSLLSSPNMSDPLVPEIAAQYVENRAIYEENAQLYTQRYAHGIRPTTEELELARARNEENLSVS